MKKIILCLFALLIGSSAIAQDVTVESLFYIKATHTLSQDAYNNLDEQFNKGEYQSALTSFLKDCQPYKENVEVNMFGLKVNFNINNSGWNNDRCEYKLSAKLLSLDEKARKTMNIGIPDDKILGVEPRISCSFSREQLVLLVDELAKMYNSNKMMHQAVYKPASSDVTKFDEKLVRMFEHDKVCKLENKEDIMRIFADDFGVQTQNIELDL